MVCENSDEVDSGKEGLGPRFLASTPGNMTAERALLSRCPGQPCPGSLSKIPRSLLGAMAAERLPWPPDWEWKLRREPTVGRRHRPGDRILLCDYGER